MIQRQARPEYPAAIITKNVQALKPYRELRYAGRTRRPLCPVRDARHLRNCQSTDSMTPAPATLAEHSAAENTGAEKSSVRCFTESKAIYQMHDIGMVALVASHLKVVQKAS